ncbi:MAG TPA: DNA replication and repair protein RecF [Anaerolineales bacterium]|nr:DNA replication and repair protein RecF [Anaerolineales bacterium]
MRLTRLSVTGFRNLNVSLRDIPEATLLLVGSNAQGKTSVLESIYFLSTLSSFQTSTDRELIDFNRISTLPAVARVSAEFEKKNTRHSIEARVILEQTTTGTRTRKEIIIDGVKKASSGSIGFFSSILFTPKMFSILESSPDARRRYLNLTLAQGIPHYTKTLSQYNKALNQRNALLKRFKEQVGDLSELGYWNELFCESASKLIAWRSDSLNALDKLANTVHSGLSDYAEELSIEYLPTLELKTNREIGFSANELNDSSAIKGRMLQTLKHIQRTEIQRGITLIGPHRDEFRIRANGIDLGNFGSRGQVKTALLSLKLAEYHWLQAIFGENPVILLDEIMSEIDAKRRIALMKTLSDHQQAFLTTTDADIYSKEFVAHSTIWRIVQGELTH